MIYSREDVLRMLKELRTYVIEKADDSSRWQMYDAGGKNVRELEQTILDKIHAMMKQV
jgi:hypothetical protein